MNTSQNVLGEFHPNTLTSMKNLAISLAHQRKYDEAKKLFDKLLPIEVNVLGALHPTVKSTKISYYNLLKEIEKETA